jgi:hypothetical protein
MSRASLKIEQGGGKMMRLSLIDKLGERIFFKRIGLRLFEGLMKKYQQEKNKDTLPSLIEIVSFQMEEKAQFKMLSDMISTLDGDPTTVTPEADFILKSISSWPPLIQDQKTTFPQCLQIMLMAKLIDQTSYETVIELAEANEKASLAVKLQLALDETLHQIAKYKHWLVDLSVSSMITKSEIGIDLSKPLRH